MCQWCPSEDVLVETLSGICHALSRNPGTDVEYPLLVALGNILRHSTASSSPRELLSIFDFVPSEYAKTRTTAEETKVREVLDEIIRLL